MYQKVPTDMDFVSREKEIARFWADNGIVEKSLKQNQGKERFTFYEGPPTANGKPHIGHVVTRAMKDLIPRYHAMKGKEVFRIGGWDTHGLPVELEVEKKLGLDGKEQIEAYGIEPFIQECKKSVWKYKQEWEDMSGRVGFWVDMDKAYVTYYDTYIESVWWSLKQIADKGLLYRGHKVVPYCPRCGTALSSHEVAQGYQEIEEYSAYVRFPVKGEESTYLLAWTTTPWTLPSNVALCVNAK
ncbi:MAG: class I tRNA ligase family protein, partial [Eubacteriales bacterium]|nr:class I tRNA ligase family protein [Eubacteriales bacterium]